LNIEDFDATHAVGLILANSHFERTGMLNLDGVKDNLATMKRHFSFLGIKDVTVLEDSSYNDMK
jgi:hypothetical protein